MAFFSVGEGTTNLLHTADEPDPPKKEMDKLEAAVLFMKSDNGEIVTVSR
ncbi:hypothetical protein GCM10028868_24810 [Virgibacillus kimchii]